MYPTIREAAAAMRAGKTSPAELLDQCLDRIAWLDARLYAWVCIDELGARETARRLQQEFDIGIDRGPLHGIPIGIKDIIDVGGLPTRASSPLTSPEPTAKDADVVRRLRDAGAIILGKTVTTEFACFDPSPTKNPWNVAHTPGGSSSGSAAAVAAGMCYGAVGTQTGGSIIRPAAYCGVYGLKPAHDEVSRDGVAPVSIHLDHVGPIGRCVDDLDLLLAGMTGAARLTASGRNAEPLHRPLRLAWLNGCFWDAADGEARQRFAAAVERLKVQGADVVELDPPFDLHEALSLHRIIMAVDAANYHRERFAKNAEQFGPNIRSLLEAGLATSSEDYERAIARQAELKVESRKWLRDYDAWIMSSTPTAAPRDLRTTGDPRFNSPWSFLGMPALTIPYAVTGIGLPLGMQIVCLNTQQAIRAGAQIEGYIAFGDQLTKRRLLDTG
jgi:Asp-tRNA(Asn)/Glu-tRNA(Gln) amidotransferase A subunit family amidase